MSKITIIGTSGAGKTVFITVLAERYSKIIPGRPYMEYSNAETKEYSAGVWGDLVDKQEWPTSTPAGTLPVLEWVLRTSSGEAHEMRVLDAPGQDIQAIYMPKKDIDSDYIELSENQKILKASIDDADVLVLLVNLCDIANAKTIRERTDFEVPIVMAAKNAFSRNARVAILFSQHDQLKALLAEKGVATSEPMNAVYEYIPGLAAVINSAGSNAYVGFVAAVAETESFSERTSSGEWGSLLRPKKGFTSEGLDEVMGWLSGILHNVSIATTNKEIDTLIEPLEVELKEISRAYTENLKKTKNVYKKTAFSVAAFCVVGFVVGFILSLFFRLSYGIIPPHPGKFVPDREEALKNAPWRTPEHHFKVNEAWSGEDDVIVENKSCDTWEYICAELTPDNGKPYALSPRRGSYSPGSKVRWNSEHNFEGGSGLVSIKVKTKGDVEENLREQKEEYDRRVDEWNRLKERVASEIQEIDRRNTLLSWVMMVGGFVFGGICPFLRKKREIARARSEIDFQLGQIQDLENQIKNLESQKI